MGFHAKHRKAAIQERARDSPKFWVKFLRLNYLFVSIGCDTSIDIERKERKRLKRESGVE